jgi:hypothetical protein
VKVEEELQVDTDHTYGFINEYHEEAINTSNIYEFTQKMDYYYWISEHNAHDSISMNNNFYNMFINLLCLPESYHINIFLDGDADTCVLGKGWEVLSVHNSRRENAVGFDHEIVMKMILPIVNAITALDILNGQSVLLAINESIYNEKSNHSLLSEFKLREVGMIIDYISNRHNK